MHIIEILMYLLAVTLIVGVLIRKSIKKPVLLIVWGVTVLLIIVQMVFIGTRWQLYTLYIAVFLISTVIYVNEIKRINLKLFIRRTLMVTASVLVGLSLVSVLVFPVVALPEPTGDYNIGTDSFIIEDDNRLELYSKDQDTFRKIKVQMWYPAETTEGYQKAPWIEDGLIVSRALSSDIGLPFFALDHTAKIPSNSYMHAPLSEDQPSYPVIILSHGWRGFKNLHTDYAEELASVGYIVVSIDHSYGSVATVFDENDVAYLNPNALPDRENTTDFIDHANQLVYTYASDITLTIDYLESINDAQSTSRFSGKLDVGNIGLLGHSTGGGADVAVALEDNRIRAVIGLDAWVEPIDQNLIESGLSVPSLFIRSETWETGENNANLISLINQSPDSELYQIDDTTHYDFAMVYMYSPLTQYIGFSGEIEDRYLVTILKTMISDFFDTTLKQDTYAQIDIDDWEEVRKITTD